MPNPKVPKEVLKAMELLPSHLKGCLHKVMSENYKKQNKGQGLANHGVTEMSQRGLLKH